MKNYQLIIPMSGKGNRFKKAGFDILKPLIKINGLTMIEHIRSMYPKNTDVIFICSEIDLDNKDLGLKRLLKNIDEKSKVVSIKPHKKGPSWAIKEAKGSISPSKPTFVNYCDFYNLWDFSKVDTFINKNNPDGLIITYRDEHPHTIWNYSYAHIQNLRDRVINIQEKVPFTDDPESEFKSTGTYYFKTGKILFESIENQIKKNQSFKGEFYTSLTYLSMLKEGLDIRHFEIEHFFQWGTPEDLNDFLWWLENYKRKKQKSNFNDVDYSLCLLCAGKGDRFTKRGFKTPKPLINFNGKSLLENAASSFKKASWKGAILSPEMSSDIFKKKLKDFKLLKLNKFSRGQADSAMKLLKIAPKNIPVVLASSDLQMSLKISNSIKEEIIKNKKWAIVFLFDSEYPFAKRKPTSYSWVSFEGNKVKDFSFKNKVSNSTNQAPLSGTFMFSSVKIAQKYIKIVLSEKDNDREPYLDDVLPHLISDKVPVFKIDADTMNCLGTPEEYLTNFYYNDSLLKF